MFGNDINEDWLAEHFEQRLIQHNKMSMADVHGTMADLFQTMSEYHSKEATKWDGRARFSLLVALTFGAIAAVMSLFYLVASVLR